MLEKLKDKFQHYKAGSETKSKPQAGQSTVSENGISWEVSRLQLLEQSEAKAWNTAKLMGVTIVGLIVAICIMMPLKKTEPFVIQVDKSTGLTEVLSIANAKDIPVSEMMDKYWLNQYVLSRESYDWRTLENDYIKTREMSMPTIFDSYASQYGQSEGSLEMQLGDRKRIVVDIHSVVPNGNGIATVRFTKRLVDTKSNMEQSRQGWTATIGYEYFPDFKVEEAKRLINPFGFKVTTYRVDPELIGG